MSDLTPIPTPWPRRLEILRLRLMPLAGFLFCVLIVAMIWHRRVGVVTGIGEVQITQYDARASLDRRLLELPPSVGQLEIFQTVQQGDLIARLDASKTHAAVDVAQLEVERLGKEVRAVLEQAKLDAYDRLDVVRRIVERRDRELRLLDLRLQGFQNRVEMRANEALLASQEQELELTTDALKERAVAQLAQIRIRGQRDETEARIGELKVVEEEIKRQIAEARKAQQDFANEILEIEPDLKSLLAPIEAAIEKQQAVVEQLNLELYDLEIRSPIDGMITAIHFRPGQSVLPGDPIVTVAGTHSKLIIFYLRDRMGIDPQINQPVRIRPRRKGARAVESKIVSIGPRFDVVPLQMLTDPTMQEWGHPVLIEKPEDLPLSPGELVDVEF